jgi:DNA-binding transcriptional MerR regulator
MAVTPVDRALFPYKMKDLCEITGVPRQVIHFYIQQGLVPEGHKTGRNMAYYGEAHATRVRLIRQLQHERFLPLRAIRAMLDEREDSFSPAQRRLLGEVKQRLAGTITRDPAMETVEVGALLERTGVLRSELDQIVELGLLSMREGTDGHAVIARDDAWMIEWLGEMRALGFTAALGFVAADLAIFDEVVSTLFQRETEMLTSRLAHLPPDQVATMVERSIPMMNTFLVRYHTARVRNFFATR